MFLFIEKVVIILRVRQATASLLDTWWHSRRKAVNLHEGYLVIRVYSGTQDGWVPVELELGRDPDPLLRGWVP